MEEKVLSAIIKFNGAVLYLKIRLINKIFYPAKAQQAIPPIDTPCTPILSHIF